MPYDIGLRDAHGGEPRSHHVGMPLERVARVRTLRLAVTREVEHEHPARASQVRRGQKPSAVRVAEPVQEHERRPATELCPVQTNALHGEERARRQARDVSWPLLFGQSAARADEVVVRRLRKGRSRLGMGELDARPVAGRPGRPYDAALLHTALRSLLGTLPRERRASTARAGLLTARRWRPWRATISQSST